VSKEVVDMSGMEEHYIIVDHTDNSGLSVHRPNEKDIKIFKAYGTMECGNTTHVVPYRLLKELEEKWLMSAMWMYAEACALLDKGEDIRTKEVPELIERMMIEISKCKVKNEQ
jgi:hypothetical protein